jgi:CheY-like chemotaxis protein
MRARRTRRTRSEGAAPIAAGGRQRRALIGIYPKILGERYDVLTALDGREAIELLASGVEVDVVLTDLRMPDLGGEALYPWLVQARPELAPRTIFVSGVGDLSESDFLSALPNALLEKPVPRVRLFERSNARSAALSERFADLTVQSSSLTTCARACARRSA